jgi:hypothetical protein
MSQYNEDFYAWTKAQADALREGKWPDVDLVRVAEEIEDLGRSIENAIESQMERLLLHLLKYRYDPSQRPRRGWRLTIRHARREISRHIRKNPGLQPYPAGYLVEAYRYARADAPDATRLPVDTFPGTCPWTIDEVLREDFFPEA